MEQPVLIEPLKEEDIEAVAAIEAASFPDPWPLESFRTEIAQNSLAVYYVARDENQIIAYIGAWIIIDEVHITTLAVAEPYRRRGIASRLIDTLADEARHKGARIITLEVRPSNTKARIFYEKLGFKELGLRKRYYSDEDALIMTREERGDPDAG